MGSLETLGRACARLVAAATLGLLLSPYSLLGGASAAAEPMGVFSAGLLVPIGFVGERAPVSADGGPAQDAPPPVPPSVDDRLDGLGEPHPLFLGAPFPLNVGYVFG